MLAILKGVLTLSLSLFCSASSNDLLSACSEDAERSTACAVEQADLAPSAGSLIQVSSNPRRADKDVLRVNMRSEERQEQYSQGQSQPAQRRPDTKVASLATHSALEQVLRSAASKPKKGGDEKKGGAKDMSKLEPASSAPKKPKSGKTSDGYPWEPLLDVDYVRDTSNPLDNSKYKVSMAGKDSESKPDKKSDKKSDEKSDKESSSSSDETSEEGEGEGDETVSAASGAPEGVDETGLPSAALYPPCPAEPCPRGGPMDDSPKEGLPGLNIVTFPSCVTRGDGSRMGIGMNTAPAGTPCIFGLDPRDNGAHCIAEEDDGKYGTYGWCWTKKDKSEWGICDDKCPARGYDAIISKREQSLDILIMQTIEEIDKKTHPCD